MAIGGIGLFEDVMPEDYLELSNGVIVKNLSELVDALGKMDKNDFELHVTKSRNDFAEWILEAYNDEKLTRKLLGAIDKEKNLRILKDVVKNTESKKVNRINMPKNKKSILKNLEGIDGGM
ncbi:hypothetical protein KAS08_04235 [Candidatus Pacearchaeota archaeon]|nr:hypothetical protein [Candidatus Pacearchaeota archaeon]